MGIKTSIKKSQLPTKYQKYRLIPTDYGVSSSVYLLDNRYVLKLFELDTDISSIESEIKLLNSISSHLPTPKIVDRFKINNHEVIIYTQIGGTIISNPTDTQIEEIGFFLKKFHKLTKNIKVPNSTLYSRERVKGLIESIDNREFLNHFNSINLELKDNGIIHGDLFMDNCKFIGNRLSGVYDFSDACCGDFHFDLAVVAISWCFNRDILDKNRVNTLIEAYGSNIDNTLFLEYMRYALLYYSITRYISNLDYKELLLKLDSLY